MYDNALLESLILVDYDSFLNVQLITLQIHVMCGTDTLVCEKRSMP